MVADDEKQTSETPKSSSDPQPAATPESESEWSSIDRMRQTVDEEKKGLEELDAKIQEAKEHEKQLRQD